MNIYRLHTDPKSLLHHDEAHEKLPKLIWGKYKDNPTELKKREKALAKDAYYAYLYALRLKRPFKEGEAAIAKDAYYAYLYAKDVLEGPFKAGEAAIAKDPEYAQLYARFILEEPFYHDGKLIAK